MTSAAFVLWTGFLVVAIAGMATGYLVGIYRRTEPPRSPLFRAMIETCLACVAIGAYFLALTLARFVLDEPAPEWIWLPNTVAVIVLLSPPIRYARVVFRLRRDYPEEGTPGPSG